MIIEGVLPCCCFLASAAACSGVRRFHNLPFGIPCEQAPIILQYGNFPLSKRWKKIDKANVTNARFIKCIFFFLLFTRILDLLEVSRQSIGECGRHLLKWRHPTESRRVQVSAVALWSNVPEFSNRLAQPKFSTVDFFLPRLEEIWCSPIFTEFCSGICVCIVTFMFSTSLRNWTFDSQCFHSVRTCVRLEFVILSFLSNIQEGPFSLNYENIQTLNR